MGRLRRWVSNLIKPIKEENYRRREREKERQKREEMPSFDPAFFLILPDGVLIAEMNSGIRATVLYVIIARPITRFREMISQNCCGPSAGIVAKFRPR